MREGSEPIFKPGEAIEALLNTATQIAGKPPRPTPTFTPATPTTAAEIVQYLWQEAYPGGASPSEALRFFDAAIRCACAPSADDAPHRAPQRRLPV